MKKLLNLFLILISMNAMSQTPKSTTLRKTFSRTTSVSTEIKAEPNTVWNLLTDSKSFSSWNSTVTQLDGEIKEGEKIQLKSTLDPDRTFKLKVKEMITDQKMIWGDAMGERVYTLSPTDEGVHFEMTEKIGSFMFPLFANKIPSFDESFEQFAQDLKSEAEKNSKSSNP